LQVVYNLNMGTLSSSSGRWILAATTLASSTVFLLGAAVNIALPSIQSYFGSNITGLEWVTNSQLLFLATLLLIGGSLGDYFGRKRIFIIGISLFTVASILAGMAPSIGILIAFQALQGIGSALMVPQSLAIINASFAENHRGQIIGLWAGISGAIAAIGPWLGGWLIENFSWRAVFFINVPISLAALIIAFIFIPESQKSRSRKIDWLGTFLVFLGLLGIAYGLITGPVDGWTHWTVLAALIGGVLAAFLFILSEARRRDPLIPLQIFQNPLVAGSNAVTLLLYFALNGILFFIILNMQQIQGYTPTEAGLYLLTFTVIISVFSGFAGSLSDKIGPRLQMILGPSVVAAGAALLGISGDQSNFFTGFLPGLLLVGAGMALVIAPLTKSALMVQPIFSGVASGVNNAVARFTALLAIAILSAVMLFVFTDRLQNTVRRSDLSPGQQQQILSQATKLGGIAIPSEFDVSSQKAAEAAIDGSFIYAFRWAMVVCAMLSAAAAIVAVFMIHNPRSGP
jgi:EmrB/QacA subfamily drug resistance transporter